MTPHADHSRFAQKQGFLHLSALIASAVIWMSAPCASLGADEGNRFEQQLHPVAAAPVGEWWKASWREGWVYQHRADFTLTARVRVREKAKVNWWQSLVSGAVESIGELNLQTNGHSLAESGVLRNQNGEILLSRYYPRTSVTRALFRKAVGEPTIVDKALDFMVVKEGRTSLVKSVVGSLFGAAVSLFVPDASMTTQTIAGAAGSFIGGKADDLFQEQLDQNGLKKRADGGIEIDTTSSLLQMNDQTKTLADLANAAVQLNEAFSRRMFLIRASAKSGDELEARQIYDEGKDLQEFADRAASDGQEKAIEWLKERMKTYREPQGVAHGVLQRETFAVSSQIFNSTERKPGDTWVVPADFFNTFLHPDLSGRFRGNVVLHYKEDAKINDLHDKKVGYEARVVEVLYQGKVGGREVTSTMEYVEPNFSAALQSDTVGRLFIDKTSGYMRQASLHMNTAVHAGLPEMKILEGFELAGDARFDVDYTCMGEALPTAAKPKNP